MFSAPDIFIENAYLAYEKQVLFDHLNIHLPANKITCLLGKSGVGKSTLLRLIAGLTTTDKNTQFHGKIFSKENSALTENITFMAQTDLLLPWLNALDNALLGYRLRNTLTSEVVLRAKKLFSDFNLEKSQTKYPRELSGGMRQRVALIRTLLEDKPIVLMDEPFSALDAITRFELQNFAVNVLKNKTVLLVTHDPMEALRIADEIIVLSGEPAKIKIKLSLKTEKPRHLSNKDVVQYQEILYENLLGLEK